MVEVGARRRLKRVPKVGKEPFAALEDRSQGWIGQILGRPQAFGHLKPIAKHQAAEFVKGSKPIAILAATPDRLYEFLLQVHLFVALPNRVRGHEVRRGQIDESILGGLSLALESFALREEVFPLRVGTTRHLRGEPRSVGFRAISVAHQSNHPIAARNVVLELLQ